MYLDSNGIWQWRYCATSNKETGYEELIPKLNIISKEDFINSKKQEDYVAEVLRLIRTVNIYPIYYFSDSGIKNEIYACTVQNVSFPVENSRAGSVLLDFMFPNLHLINAGNNQNNCLYSRFYDDVKFSKCLTRHMKNYKFTNIRTPFFMYGRFFWSTATNFNCMRAKAVYQHFCKDGYTVYDSSAGYGSRLLGARTARKHLTYVGCEPNSNTAFNLNKLGQYLGSYQIIPVGSEEVQLEKESIDFAFTCPPYFGVERYSEEATQSIIKFPEYTQWLRGFVKPTLERTYKALRPGRYAVYALAQQIYYRNIKYSLSSDWTKIALQVGFDLVDRIGITNMSRKKPDNAEQYFVFRKKGG